LSKLEIEIRDSLNEVHAMMGQTKVDADRARALIKRLLELADAAYDAGYPLSEQFLEKAADKLCARAGLQYSSHAQQATI
jgi:methylphosphotriester-DNA--protein-cysteine methyltransferase